MIDLHCHILPAIDDGACDLSVSLKMARAAVAQGIKTVACTPHIMPGVYENSGPAIRAAVGRLQQSLDRQGIPLRLVCGADIHMAPNTVEGLRSGHLLTIAESRYVLIEPPQQALPPRSESFFFELLAAGYVPILTHPERFSWISSRYRALKRLINDGVWMQCTADAYAGRFGRGALYWAQRMLDDGCVHLIASDAHDDERRPPNLAIARELIAERIGAELADHLVVTRPLGILNNEPPSTLPAPLRRSPEKGRHSIVEQFRGLSGRLRELFNPNQEH